MNDDRPSTFDELDQSIREFAASEIARRADLTPRGRIANEWLRPRRTFTPEMRPPRLVVVCNAHCASADDRFPTIAEVYDVPGVGPTIHAAGHGSWMAPASATGNWFFRDSVSTAPLDELGATYDVVCPNCLDEFAADSDDLRRAVQRFRRTARRSQRVVVGAD